MDIKRTDLALLVALDALLTERNVTRAAARLHISQPALSTQLARLRELFGDPLLVPAARGMVPNPRALVLQQPLNERLAQLQDLLCRQRDFDPARTERRFGIAATDYAQLVVVAPLMAPLVQQAPGMRLAVVNLDARQVSRQLEAGEIDLVIGTRRMISRSFRARRLLDERFVLVHRDGHPRLVGPPDLATFCDLEHVMVSPDGGGFFGAVDEELERHGMRRRVVVSLPSFLAVPHLVAASDLVAALPLRLARQYSELLTLTELPLQVTGFALHAGWHPRSQHDAGHRWLRRQLAEQLAVRQVPGGLPWP